MEAADDPNVSTRDITLADARARVAEAVQMGAITFLRSKSRYLAGECAVR